MSEISDDRDVNDRDIEAERLIEHASHLASDENIVIRAERGRAYLHDLEKRKLDKQRKERLGDLYRKMAFDAVSLGSLGYGVYAAANGNFRNAAIAAGVLAVSKLVDYKSFWKNTPPY